MRLAAKAAQDMVDGRPVRLAALVHSLRTFIRSALCLEDIPADVQVPDRGVASGQWPGWRSRWCRSGQCPWRWREEVAQAARQPAVVPGMGMGMAMGGSEGPLRPQPASRAPRALQVFRRIDTGTGTSGVMCMAMRWPCQERRASCSSDSQVSMGPG